MSNFYHIYEYNKFLKKLEKNISDKNNKYINLTKNNNLFNNKYLDYCNYNIYETHTKYSEKTNKQIPYTQTQTQEQEITKHKHTYENSNSFYDKNILTKETYEKEENKYTKNIENTEQKTPTLNNNDKTKINIIIDKQFITIQDLLDVINNYPDDDNIIYNIDIKALHKIKTPLLQLHNMIGIENLKQNIVYQLLYYIQQMHIYQHNDEFIQNDYMHMVLYGPPGCGKTEIANIIGSIYSKLGILKKQTFKKVSRSDLVSGYLGQTAIKTKEIVNEALGGVLFIDEAYSFGNKDDKLDTFAKECIDTLCELLSYHKNNLMVIIAGYEKELEDCFFRINRGLISRFSWKFHIDDYSSNDILQIFKKKINDIGWIYESNIDEKWFEKNREYFKYSGRDIENFLSKIKICHSSRVFCLDEKLKKKINDIDIENGFKLFINNREIKQEYNHNLHSMYI